MLTRDGAPWAKVEIKGKTYLVENTWYERQRVNVSDQDGSDHLRSTMQDNLRVIVLTDRQHFCFRACARGCVYFGKTLELLLSTSQQNYHSVRLRIVITCCCAVTLLPTTTDYEELPGTVVDALVNIRMRRNLKQMCRPTMPIPKQGVHFVSMPALKIIMRQVVMELFASHRCWYSPGLECVAFNSGLFLLYCSARVDGFEGTIGKPHKAGPTYPAMHTSRTAFDSEHRSAPLDLELEALPPPLRVGHHSR